MTANGPSNVINTACGCGGTGIGCVDCLTEPVVRLCSPDEVSATSRLFGIPVSGGGPDGPHDPACGGCHGTADTGTCPYSVRIREHAARLGFTEGA